MESGDFALRRGTIWIGNPICGSVKLVAYFVGEELSQKGAKQQSG